MIEAKTFFNKRGKRLVGVLDNNQFDSPLIIFLHGFAGNKDENGLFIEAEKYFSERNYNTLRFDFEGVGDSEGEFKDSTLARHVDDFKIVLGEIKKTYNNTKIGVIGFSLGATIALLHSSEDVDSYAFWSPALFPREDMFPRYNTENIKQELLNKGFLEKSGLKVGHQIINDLGNCDLKKNMKGLRKPVLLVHGTGDLRINYKSTVRGQKYFPNAHLEIIFEASHSYKQNPVHREMLFSKTFNWFEKQFRG